MLSWISLLFFNWLRTPPHLAMNGCKSKKCANLAIFALQSIYDENIHLDDQKSETFTIVTRLFSMHQIAWKPRKIWLCLCWIISKLSVHNESFVLHLFEGERKLVLPNWQIVRHFIGYWKLIKPLVVIRCVRWQKSSACCFHNLLLIPFWLAQRGTRWRLGCFTFHRSKI